MFGTNMRRVGFCCLQAEDSSAAFECFWLQLELGGSNDGPLIDPSNCLDACFQKESASFFENFEIVSKRNEADFSDQCFAEIFHGDGIYAEGNGFATFGISKVINYY